MYSVEDLLISHGYKLPQSTAPTPTPAPAAPSPSPPSYDGRREILENRVGHGPVNGYGRDGAPYGSRGYPPNDNECRDRNHPGSNQDTHSLGDSITSDSGFCEGPRGVYSQSRGPKDVSYWRRRGQDFTVLLDYADFREPRGGGRGGGEGGYVRTDGLQQRGQNVSTEERQTERQLWANQAQVQAQAQAQAQIQAQAQAQARSREREAALHQWRMAAERKCQSLGTDEWRPASSFGRQMSDCEAEKWAREKMRQHARTPEGAVLPRTKAKSQSLPRMLQPESLQYVDMSGSGHSLYRRVNGHPAHPTPDPYGRHHSETGGQRWPPENGRPASANQAAITPKPRFSRPLRPPSYEVHQQTRGSCEMLSGESPAPQARDRTPVPNLRVGDPRLDYFAQDLGGSGAEPPGYIPPPSYKRAPVPRGSQRSPYGDVPVAYRYRGEVLYQQVGPDGVYWYSRHPGGSWPEPQRDRANLPSRRKLYPGYSPQQPGGVQYIPFDDPRVRHISGGTAGNSLTDADKIRHIRNNELPSVTVSEPPSSSDDSAFLPPPLGHHASPCPKAGSRSPVDHDSDQNKWHHGDLHKETDNNNFPATDQNCNDRYPKAPPGPSSAFQPSSSSRQSSCSDQGFAETGTITQVKKIAPNSGPDTNRNTKRRVSETIFCLVSVPIQIPAKETADQNNNNTALCLSTNATMEPIAGQEQNSQSLRSQSLTEMSLKPLPHISTSSSFCMRNSKRAPLRKEIVDAWALQAMADKELCYAGSWPGDQYRNQETQTISPPMTVKCSPQTSADPGVPEPGQPASSETTTEGTDCSSGSYGSYSMAGQKNLHPSSNSAFSRLSISPAQPLSLPPAGTTQPQTSPSPGTAQPQSLPTPSPRAARGAEQLASPKRSASKPADNPTSEQVAFGQFLLKPVNRRPWDAIEELECINKEMEDQIEKRPSTEPCLEDLEEAYQNILELSETGEAGGSGSTTQDTATLDPTREAASLAEQNQYQPSHIYSRSSGSDSRGSGLDPVPREARSAFSRPPPDRPTTTASVRPPREDMSLSAHPSPRDYAPLSSHADPSQTYRQDIPVPQESLLRDVGLTVYTEAPGGPGEPCQRSPLSIFHTPLSFPVSHSTPPHHQEVGQSLHMSWESRLSVVKSHSEDLNISRAVERKTDNVPRFRGEPQPSLRRARSENSRSPRAEGSPRVGRLSRESAFTHEDDGEDRYYISREPLRWGDEATLADRHLETLLVQEKANTKPAEDLSNLYEVKCAEGIPENESIEQRAARILGIAVPVEALGARDRQDEGAKQGHPDMTSPDSEGLTGDSQELRIPDRETQKVSGKSEQVTQEFLESHGQGQQAAEEDEEEGKTGSSEDKREGGSQPAIEEETQLAGGGERNSLVLVELPEFPPSKLPLSLPVTPDQELALSVGWGEKGGHDISRVTEDLSDDKLTSSSSSSSLSSCSVVSPGRTTIEVQGHMKEMDSESCVPGFGIRNSEAGGNGEQEGERKGEQGVEREGVGEQEGERDTEEDMAQAEEREQVQEEEEEQEEEEQEEEEEEATTDEDRGGERHETEKSMQEPDEEEELGEEDEDQEGEMKRVDEDEEREQPEAVLSTKQEQEEELKSAEDLQVKELKIAEEEEEKEVELKIEEEDEKETELKTAEEGEKEVELKIQEEETKETELKTEEEEEEEKEVELKIEEEEKETELKTEEEEEEEREAELKTEEEEEKEPELKTEEEEEEVEKEVELEIKVEEVKKEEEQRQTELEVKRKEEGRSKEGDKEKEEQPKPLPRPQKPPLLPKPQPKPRSSATVAKREITLPLSFNVTCGSATLEDEELLSVSDSYDPSRVERV